VTNACGACGGTTLVPHLRLAHHFGLDSLVPTTDRHGSAFSDLVRCAACGHIQLARFPSAPELAEAYGEAESEDYVEEEAGQRATARTALGRIERHREPGRLLDLGCWVGFLLAEASDRGWEPTGVEPSEFASRFARERLGLNVLHAGLDDADLPARAFDAVVMADVIEHLPDAAFALDRVASLLAADGVLYLALPNAGSRVARALGPRSWSVIPTHVHYFTRSSLFTLLRRRGFTPLWAGTAPKAFTARYYLERLGGYSPPLARGLVGAASAGGVAERMLAPDFRDRMAVVARGPLK